MLKKSLFAAVLAFIFQFCIAQDVLNVEVFANVKLTDDRYSGSWSYVDTTGAEYALLGAKSGTSFFNIDDPNNVTELDFVSGPVTNWREITVIGHYAYVVTDVSDTGHGMQVIDLSYLPDSVHLVTTYAETFTKGHIIQKDIDSEDPYVYINGTSTTQGVHILDVSNPAFPIEVGLYVPGYYIHDCHVRGNLLFAAAFHMGQMDIVDISDKTNPTLITVLHYGGSNTHSSSLSEDGKYLFIADEKNGNPARIWNIEDLQNPFEVAQYSANLAALVHNPYILGDFCHIAHNTEGFRVLDIADPTLPVEVGFYDTYLGPSGGFFGLWSACPYFPSGKIIGGDRHNGLYVWEFNQTRAGRFYGITRDSFTKEVLLNAEIIVLETQDTLPADLQGNFKFGGLEGAYNLIFNAFGYQQKMVPVTLLEGDSLLLDIEMVPENLDAIITGIVLDSFTLEPIANAEIEIVELAQQIFTDDFGNFEKLLSAGDYSLIITATNYLPKSLNFNLLPLDSLHFEIVLALDPANSVFEKNRLETLEISPNPTSDLLFIKWNNEDAAYELVVRDNFGKKVNAFQVNGRTDFVLEKNNLAPGIYLLELIANKKILKVGKVLFQ